LQSDPTARREDDGTGADSAFEGEARGPTKLHAEANAPREDSAARYENSANGDFNIFRQPWLVVACLLLVASVVLLLLSRADAAFVCAALGVSAWFWNVRAGLKRKHDLVKASGRNWVQRDEEEDED
jgi:Flp pilus assembly protein TadB